MLAAPSHPYANPPRPGPDSVINAIPEALNAIALVISFLLTSCGMTACLAGIKNDQPIPWAKPASMRIHIEITSVYMATPTKPAMIMIASWLYWIIFFRFQRSANVPPNTEKIRIGGAKADPPRPT